MTARAIYARAFLVEWLERKAPANVTIAWMLIGLALNLGQTWLFQRLWVGLIFILLVHACWGICQALLFLFMIFDGRRDARILFPVMLTALAAFFLGSSLLNKTGDQIAFAFLRPAYDRAVADAESKLPPHQAALVAFPWTDGIPDGGSAIVYDESDAIAGISMQTWQEISPQLGRLVNGNPHSCYRFAEPHYFLCGFG